MNSFDRFLILFNKAWITLVVGACIYGIAYLIFWNPPDLLRGPFGRVIIIIAAFLFHLFLVAWVSHDARNRGEDSVPVWAIFIFLFGLLGMLVYFVARPPLPIEEEDFAD